MKKIWLLIVMAVAVISSCGQEILDSGNDVSQTDPIVFNLTANHPDATKAVKTDWEAGDAVFVFFDKAPAPKHLKMTYDGTKWTSLEYDGVTAAPGTLGLQNSDTGTMRAVFLPFGSDASVKAKGTDFEFSETCYAYYLTATLSYTVTDNKVSGNFQMQIPDGYVQFFVEDANATDEAYLLGTDAVIPVGVASISADGTVNETSNKTYVDDMPGYAYSGGYLFSGKINTNYSSKRWENQSAVEAHAYYFAKTKVSDGTRHDYFVSGKTLDSHSAVKLPANNNVYNPGNGEGKWIPVGPDKFVIFYRNNGENPFLVSWATCNYDASLPEERGTLLSFIDAENSQGSIEIPTSLRLPSKDLFSILADQTHTTITVHGKRGYVISASRGFIFLPVTTGDSTCDYWSADPHDDANNAWYFSFSGPLAEKNYMYFQSKTQILAVRMIR